MHMLVNMLLGSCLEPHRLRRVLAVHLKQVLYVDWIVFLIEVSYQG